MSATALQAILATLGGQRAAITVAHAENLPRGDMERELRNRGLALYTPALPLWRSAWPGVRFGVSALGDMRVDSCTTAAGAITLTTRTHVDRSLACELPYDASRMRRELEVEPWIKSAKDLAVATAWVAAETCIADHVVYEHARYDYGEDALIVVRGPVSPLGEAYALCGGDAARWCGLEREAPAALAALLAALTERELRRLESMAGCSADLVLVGGDTPVPAADKDLVRRYDLPVLGAAAQQLAGEGLRWGLQTLALGRSEGRELIQALKPAALLAPSDAAPVGELCGQCCALWLTVSRAELLKGPSHARALGASLLAIGGGRGLIVDLEDAGLSRCTNQVERDLLGASAAAMLEVVGGFAD